MTGLAAARHTDARVRHRHQIVTRLTTTECLIVIHGKRHPVLRTVTGIAGIRRRDMLKMLAGRDTAIMTTATQPQHLLVIYAYDRRPGRRCMTGLTIIRRLDVRRMLTRGDHTIVTG